MGTSVSVQDFIDQFGKNVSVIMRHTEDFKSKVFKILEIFLL